MDKEQMLMYLRMAIIIYGIGFIFTSITLALLFSNFWFMLVAIGLLFVVWGFKGKSIDRDLFEYYKKYGVDF